MYSRPFASKALFWVILKNFSSPLTLLYNRRTRVETLFWKGSSARAIFPPKSHRSAFKLRSIARKDLATHSSRSNTVGFWFSSRASFGPFGWIFNWKVREESWIFWPLCCEVWKQSDAILGGKSPLRLNPFKTRFPPLFFHIIKKSQRRTEIHSKSLKKPLLRQKDDYTSQVR